MINVWKSGRTMRDEEVGETENGEVRVRMKLGNQLWHSGRDPVAWQPDLPGRQGVYVSQK